MARVHNTKVKPGQVWSLIVDGRILDKWKIHSLTPNNEGYDVIGFPAIGPAPHHATGTKFSNRSVRFGSTDPHGHPLNWDSHWTLESDSDSDPPTLRSGIAPSKEVDISDWKVWRHKAPGECVCGIPKQVCSYHKDT
jgi:hypothetical protein